MIKAADVAKMLEEHDPRVDRFIDEVMVPIFLNSGNRINIDSIKVSDYFEHTILPKRFIRELNKRGFSVRYECDDRPCGSCWYEVEIPPQGN